MLSDTKALLDEPPLSQQTLAASEAFMDGRFGEALETSESLIDKMPREAWSWRFKGECLLFLQRYEDAAECFQKAMELGAYGTEDTFLWQAMALQNAGEPEKAKAVLESFLAQDGGLPDLTHKAQSSLGDLRRDVSS